MSNHEAWVDNLDKAIIENEKKDQPNKNTWSKVGFVAIMLLILVAAVAVYRNLGIGTLVTNDKIISSMGTSIGLSTITDNLEVRPGDISVQFKDYNAEINLDMSDISISNMMYLDDYFYISYESSDKSVFVELIMSKDIPTEVELSNEAIDKLNKPNVIVAESSEDTKLNKVIKKAAVNAYGQGYIVVIQQTDKENADKTFEQNMASAVLDSILFSELDDNLRRTYLELDGFGTYNIEQIEGFEHVGVYIDDTKSLRVYDLENEKDMLLVTSINNTLLGDYTDGSNLKQRDGWNNLYDTLDSSDDKSDGYRAFAVQTSKGMYLFQVAKDMPSNTEEKLIELLGIRPDDTYIKPIFVEESNE